MIQPSVGTTITSEEGVTLVHPCNQPAPLVVNGGAYAGCALLNGHDGPHAITIEWSSDR